MFHRHLNRIASVGVCAVVFAASGSALAAGKEAKDGKESKRAICTAALTTYRNAIEREKAGQVQEALSLFNECAEASACTFSTKCRARADKLVSDLPTVVPVVTDESGSPKIDCEVKVDGRTLTNHLDGRGLPVEAGLHEFSFATDKGVFATEKILIVEGQRNRTIAASMGGAKASSAPPAAETVAVAAPSPEKPAPAKPPAETPEETPTEASAKGTDEPAPTQARPKSGGRGPLPYVLGIAGIAGIGAGAVLTYWGKKDNDALVSQCSPNCSPASVDHVRSMYIASDISIGVGAAALGVAAILFATSHPAEDKPAPHAATVFDVHPTRSGAFATVQGAF